jgi:hypothetical protein
MGSRRKGPSTTKFIAEQFWYQLMLGFLVNIELKPVIWALGLREISYFLS